MPINRTTPQNSEVVKENEFKGVLRLSEIRSITIRHDGSPKNFGETYDNWDLQAVSISLVSNDSGEFLNIYNSANDRNRSNFVQRFTGDRRSITLYRQRTQGN
ncbi:MAG: hypothetical protein H7319_02205 [Spirosoma sp.]|nr:hypothetical protein [Spirosoma sp.]